MHTQAGKGVLSSWLKGGNRYNLTKRILHVLTKGILHVSRNAAGLRSNWQT